METTKPSTTPKGWKRLIYTERAAEDEERRAMLRVVNSLILHLHPVRVPAGALRFTYTWGLGGISTLLCLILGLTGALLMFRYEPDIDRAYLSILALETEVAFGSLIRSLHHWSANLLVVTSFLHLIRVFLSGGFKGGRRFNWIIGLIIFVFILAFNFTGYLLPWDQLAYWAITVSSSIIRYVPLVGREIATALLGGFEVGQAALRNFYALHIAVLPGATLALLGYHFWRIRKDGGISQPEPGSGEQPERVTTLPHLVRRELAVGALAAMALVAFAMLVRAPLGGVADPLRSPNPAKAAWYFGALQELLLHMETEASLVLLAIIFAGALLLPQLDRHDGDIGIYFRSQRGRQAALLGLVIGINLTPALIVADEVWIDWVAWLPTWPTFVANGLVPVAVILTLMCGVYLLARVSLKARHGEALVALFTFVVTAVLVMTVVCGLFRGANMDLVLPGM